MEKQSAGDKFLDDMTDLHWSKEPMLKTDKSRIAAVIIVGVAIALWIIRPF